MERLNNIENVIKDLNFLIAHEERGTGLLDKIQMMKQMITYLEMCLDE